MHLSARQVSPSPSFFFSLSKFIKSPGFLRHPDDIPFVRASFVEFCDVMQCGDGEGGVNFDSLFLVLEMWF